MSRIRNGSGKDFMSKDVHSGAWDQECEKLEMSLVLSERAVTLCEISR